ncbi:MAG: L-threonylcarbamoyladenylate synthase [Chloroflexi bacterium]|nr:L-threonylcarbamoyladenylate synthase [Chloroflexota bacterium]
MTGEGHPGRRVTLPRVLPARDPASIAEAVSALRAGRLVAVPTETVYGVACLLDAAAIERLLDAKRRPPSKGITLLVDDIAQAASVAEMSPAARRLAERHWPGPLTLVLPVRADVSLPESLTGETGAIGCRVPDHPAPRALARALARALGPIPLTSANLSGAPDARDAAEVVRQLGASLAVVLDDGPSPGGVPSTVVRFRDAGAPLELLRQGAIPFETLVEEARG